MNAQLSNRDLSLFVVPLPSSYIYSAAISSVQKPRCRHCDVRDVLPSVQAFIVSLCAGGGDRQDRESMRRRRRQVRQVWSSFIDSARPRRTARRLTARRRTAREREYRLVHCVAAEYQSRRLRFRVSSLKRKVWYSFIDLARPRRTTANRE